MDPKNRIYRDEDFLSPELFEVKLFELDDIQEMNMAMDFKAIASKYIELEKILRWQHKSEKHIRDARARAVIDAILSPNPVSEMSKIVNTFIVNVAIKQMLSDICQHLNMDIINVKDSLKRLKYNQG